MDLPQIKAALHHLCSELEPLLTATLAPNSSHEKLGALFQLATQAHALDKALPPHFSAAPVSSLASKTHELASGLLFAQKMANNPLALRSLLNHLSDQTSQILSQLSK